MCVSPPYSGQGAGNPLQWTVWAGHTSGNIHICIQISMLTIIFCLVNPPPWNATLPVSVSRSIWPMILTMTALLSSWTGSSSHIDVLAGKTCRNWDANLYFLLKWQIQTHNPLDLPSNAFKWKSNYIFGSSICIKKDANLAGLNWGQP